MAQPDQNKRETGPTLADFKEFLSARASDLYAQFQNPELAEQIDQLQYENRRLRDRIDQMQRAHTSLRENMNEQVAAEVEEALKQQETTREEAIQEAIVQQQKAVASRAVEHEKDLTNLQHVINTYTDQKRSLREKVQSLEEKVKSLQSLDDRQNAREGRNVKSSETAMLQAAVEDLQRKLKQEKEQHLTARDNLKKVRESSARELKALKESLQQKVAEAVQFQELQNDELQLKLNEKEDLAGKQADEICKLEQSNKSLEDQITSLQKETATLKGALEVQRQHQRRPAKREEEGRVAKCCHGTSAVQIQALNDALHPTMLAVLGKVAQRYQTFADLLRGLKLLEAQIRSFGRLGASLCSEAADTMDLLSSLSEKSMSTNTLRKNMNAPLNLKLLQVIAGLRAIQKHAKSSKQ